MDHETDLCSSLSLSLSLCLSFSLSFGGCGGCERAPVRAPLLYGGRALDKRMGGQEDGWGGLGASGDGARRRRPSPPARSSRGAPPPPPAAAAWRARHAPPPSGARREEHRRCGRTRASPFHATAEVRIAASPAVARRRQQRPFARVVCVEGGVSDIFANAARCGAREGRLWRRSAAYAMSWSACCTNAASGWRTAKESHSTIHDRGRSIRSETAETVCTVSLHLRWRRASRRGRRNVPITGIQPAACRGCTGGAVNMPSCTGVWRQ